MKRSRRPRGAFTILGVVALGTLGVAALLYLGDLGPFSPRPATAAAAGLQAARSIARTAWVRANLELAVVVLQVAAVAALFLSRLVPASRLADRGRAGFAGAMVGLGLCGTLCAAYGSEFALFAGGTMAVLLNVGLLGTHSTLAETSASRPVEVAGARLAA